MKLRQLPLLAACGLAAVLAAAPVATAFAKDATPAAAQVPQQLLLRVGVDATGKVQTATVLNAGDVPALVQPAIEMARKLQFAPARKHGQPVPSETSLSMTLALEPRAGGGFGIGLRRAQNGPSVAEMRTWKPPSVGRDNGGLVVVSVDLKPDGTTDMDSFKEEKVELRVPSSFAHERFVDAAHAQIKATRFLLDKVDGIETPSRVSVAFQFNGGPRKRDRDEDPRHPKPGQDEERPSLTAVSKIEGVELPKIDYHAPAK